VRAWERFTLLSHFDGAISRHSYDQLGPLKPLFGVARPLRQRKEVHARQHLHDLPPMAGW
jgi:hypothetical protein